MKPGDIVCVRGEWFRVVSEPFGASDVEFIVIQTITTPRRKRVIDVRDVRACEHVVNLFATSNHPFWS